MYSDVIADFLTRIRNAVRANHKIVEIPASNLKVEIATTLKSSQSLLTYFDRSTGVTLLKVKLKTEEKFIFCETMKLFY